MTNRMLLCLGAGYSARVAADRARHDGWRLIGTSRTDEGCDRLRSAGFDAIRFDGTGASDDLRTAITSASHVLMSIAPEPDAPPDASDPILTHHVADLGQATNLTWIGYLSTVGVYGNHDGAWVDEDTICKPVSKRSVARLEAERQWQALAASQTAGWRLHIYRLSGIYGPGRNPIARIKAGRSRRIVKPGQVFNRIHVEDIATSVMAGLHGHGDAIVYNVTDNEPAPPQDVIAHAAEIAGLAAPPEQTFEDADMTPMARSFYGENKRVRNDRMKTDLGVSLTYPTYREGLASLVADG